MQSFLPVRITHVPQGPMQLYDASRACCLVETVNILHYQGHGQEIGMWPEQAKRMQHVWKKQWVP